MIPGMNPRDVAKAMKRMGIQQKDIDAKQVIIRCEGKDIIIDNPQVAKVNMMGQESWQITGTAKEEQRSTQPDIKEEDIQTVIEQTGKNREEAETAIKEANGDLAQAIINLQ